MDADHERWIEVACEISGRRLTGAEWRRFSSGAAPRIDPCPTV